jgi:hypothetical protein
MIGIDDGDPPNPRGPHVGAYFHPGMIARLEAWLGRSFSGLSPEPDGPDVNGSLRYGPFTADLIMEFNNTMWSTLGTKDANGCLVFNGNDQTTSFQFGHGNAPDDVLNPAATNDIEVAIYDLGRVR